MGGRAVAEHERAAHDFAIESGRVETGAVVGLRFAHEIRVKRERSFQAKVLALGTILEERPRLLQGSGRVGGVELISGLGAAANLAARLAIEAGQMFLARCRAG